MTDRGRIVRFLEDQLSDGARTVTIRGFSRRAQLDRRVDLMTIADDDGVWLTLENPAHGRGRVVARRQAADPHPHDGTGSRFMPPRQHARQDSPPRGDAWPRACRSPTPSTTCRRRVSLARSLSATAVELVERANVPDCQRWPRGRHATHRARLRPAGWSIRPCLAQPEPCLARRSRSKRTRALAPPSHCPAAALSSGAERTPRRPRSSLDITLAHAGQPRLTARCRPRGSVKARSSPAPGATSRPVRPTRVDSRPSSAEPAAPNPDGGEELT